MSAYLEKLHSEVFEPVRNEVPDLIVGKERYLLISEVLDRLPERQAQAMRDYLTAVLEHMEYTSASDVDLGGIGGQNHIWFRTYGAKKTLA